MLFFFNCSSTLSPVAATPEGGNTLEHPPDPHKRKQHFSLFPPFYPPFPTCSAIPPSTTFWGKKTRIWHLLCGAPPVPTTLYSRSVMTLDLGLRSYFSTFFAIFFSPPQKNTHSPFPSFFIPKSAPPQGIPGRFVAKQCLQRQEPPPAPLRGLTTPLLLGPFPLIRWIPPPASPRSGCFASLPSIPSLCFSTSSLLWALFFLSSPNFLFSSPIYTSIRAGTIPRSAASHFFYVLLFYLPLFSSPLFSLILISLFYFLSSFFLSYFLSSFFFLFFYLLSFLSSFFFSYFLSSFFSYFLSFSSLLFFFLFSLGFFFYFFYFSVFSLLFFSFFFSHFSSLLPFLLYFPTAFFYVFSIFYLLSSTFFFYFLLYFLSTFLLFSTVFYFLIVFYFSFFYFSFFLFSLFFLFFTFYSSLLFFFLLFCFFSVFSSIFFYFLIFYFLFNFFIFSIIF